MEQILATNKQTATNNAAGLSFSNLGKTAGAAWKSMSALSKFSLVAGVVTTAISLISAAWNYFSEQAERAAQRMQELDEEYQELQSTISSAASEYRSLKTTSEEIIPRFVELAEGVDKFGKNVSLTDERTVNTSTTSYISSVSNKFCATPTQVCCSAFSLYSRD